MNTPEWYSGLDPSNRVTKTVNAVLEKMDANAEGQPELGMLSESLELEREPNWRAFLIGLRGLVYAKIGDTGLAAEDLQLALDTFAHHRKSFDDVSRVYCQVSYQLGVIHWEQENWELSSSCFLRCIPHMHDVYADAPVFIGNILGFLDLCFASMGRYGESLALSEGVAWERERDCASVESLVIAYGNLERWRKAKLALGVLEKDCSDWEFFPRVLDYAKRHRLLEE